MISPAPIDADGAVTLSGDAVACTVTIHIKVQGVVDPVTMDLTLEGAEHLAMGLNLIVNQVNHARLLVAEAAMKSSVVN